MFTNISGTVYSMWNEVIFEYTCDEESDIEMEIIDYATDEVLGVKKFYSSTSAKVNVPPMIFDMMLPQARLKEATCMVYPESGFPLIRTQVGTENSGIIAFTYSEEDINGCVLLNTLPKSRLLYSGERDQVSAVVISVTNKYCEIYGCRWGSDSEELITTIYSTATRGSILDLHVNADDFCQTYESIRVDIMVDYTPFDTLSYSFVNESSGGYRVAWINSKGGIEHYTFPAVVDQTRSSSGAVTKSLRSAYGTYEEIIALSEIVSSLKVWRVTSTGYKEIEVLTTEQAIRQDGALSIINIKISENG